MSKEPRYTVCTIITKDINLVVDADFLRAKGETHESIYKAGIKALNENKVETNQ